MRVTVEIPDQLHSAARKLAAKEQTTLARLVEEGLRQVLAEIKKKAE